MLHVSVISLIEHLWNKIKVRLWLPQKEEKRWHTKEAWPKKKEKERGVTMSQKKGDMDDSREKKPLGVSHIHPSIHSFHTLAPFDQDCMTCFSMDPIFDFTINRIQVCLILILPWAPQRPVVVGKIKGKHCPGKEIQDECLERVILGALPYFQEIF